MNEEEPQNEQKEEQQEPFNLEKALNALSKLYELKPDEEDFFKALKHEGAKAQEPFLDALAEELASFDQDSVPKNLEMELLREGITDTCQLYGMADHFAMKLFLERFADAHNLKGYTKDGNITLHNSDTTFEIKYDSTRTDTLDFVIKQKFEEPIDFRATLEGLTKRLKSRCYIQFAHHTKRMIADEPGDNLYENILKYFTEHIVGNGKFHGISIKDISRVKDFNSLPARVMKENDFAIIFDMGLIDLTVSKKEITISYRLIGLEDGNGFQYGKDLVKIHQCLDIESYIVPMHR